ncbi:uncharacterized protein A4U43_C10F7950, partial [Asparagus officinalis]
LEILSHWEALMLELLLCHFVVQESFAYLQTLSLSQKFTLIMCSLVLLQAAISRFQL